MQNLYLFIYNLKLMNMNRWLICGNEMEFQQMERENSAFTKPNWHDQHPLLAKSTSTKNFNSKKKDSEKISLKNTNKHQKEKQNIVPSLMISRKQSHQIINAKNYHQQKIIQYRSEQDNNSPKIQYKKIIPATRVNAQGIRYPYVRNHTTITPLRIQKPSNIKIFYFNRFQDQIKKHNPQVTTENSTIPQSPRKSLKRMKTMPQITQQVSQSLLFCNEIETKAHQIGAGVTKSMDYTDTVKSINLKGTQNLHEIECIKAQSIADEEIQDEFSIVVSPLDEQIDFQKEDVIRDIWMGFAGKDLKSKESLYANSADTAEE